MAAIDGGWAWRGARAPDSCSIYIDIRTLPEVMPTDILKEIRGVVDEINRRIKKNIKPNIDVSLNEKGKLFKKSDWKPEMLKVICSFFDDKIVNLHLDKKIKCLKPKLIKI